MLLLEHEAKRIASAFHIEIPKARLCRSPRECVEAGHQIGYPVMIKAQIPAKERMKHGGILEASNDDELLSRSKAMFENIIAGHEVNEVLVEEKIDALREFYVALTFNWATQVPLFLFSAAGGAGVEERVSEGHLLKVELRSPTKPAEDQLLKTLRGEGLDPDETERMLRTTRGLETIFKELHAEMIEINPLAETSRGRIVALDVRIVLDNDALASLKTIRQRISDILGKKEPMEPPRRENYVELDGDIGVIGNGAGLVLATMDLVKLHGGQPADFLDLGGGATKEAVVKALDRLSRVSRLRCILVNVLGGITRCDEIARGIVESIETMKLPKMYVRLVGTNEDEAKSILQDAGISYYDDMESLIQAAVRG